MFSGKRNLYMSGFQNLYIVNNLILNTLKGLRPSSDVVLLLCQTKLQFGSTVAWQEINSDSDVVPVTILILAPGPVRTSC